MTVEELLQKLVELAREGKGQADVWVPDSNHGHILRGVELGSSTIRINDTLVTELTVRLK